MIATAAESVTLETFGWNWMNFAFQTITWVIVLSWLLLAIRATRSFLGNGRSERPLWLLVIWLIPVLGALSALSAFRSKPGSLPAAG